MTRKNFQTTHKTTAIIAMIVVCLLCFALFFVSACGTETSTDYTKKSYAKQEDASVIVKNGSFEYGTTETTVGSYPVSSITGWSIEKDGTSAAYTTSGIVNIADSYWGDDDENLVTTEDYWSDTQTDIYNALASNSNIQKLLAQKLGFDKLSSLTSKVNDWIVDNKSITKVETSSDITDAHLIKMYAGLLRGYENTEYFPNSYTLENPSTHEGAVVGETKMLMLNSYQSEPMFGTAIKATSSTSVTLEKGKSCKISLWVKTVDLSYAEDSNGGANIRLSNTFNGTTQKEYGIYNINTNGEWSQYTIYVTADENYETTISVIVGIGFGGSSSSDQADFTRGTVYFDDIVCEQDVELPVGATPYFVDFNATNKQLVKSNNTTSQTFVYDLTFDGALSTLDTKYGINDYINNFEVRYDDSVLADETLNINGEVTKSFASSTLPTIQVSSNVLTIKNFKDIGYKFTLTSNEFALANDEYLFVMFNLSNYDLGNFEATGIAITLTDKAIYNEGSADERNFAKSAQTVTTLTDEGKVIILVKNTSTDEENVKRYFDINIYLGPQATSEIARSYATGSLEIKDFKFIKNGLTDTPLTEEYNKNVKPFYTLFANSASSTITLEAGKTTSSDPTYTFTSAETDGGVIVDNPTKVKYYSGVTRDSVYVSSTGKDYSINTKSTAGLINTEYLDNYTMLPNVKDALGVNARTEDDQNRQPIVIYNATSDNYAYISENKTIAANAYATISISVLTNNGATASVYLINPSTKRVISWSAISNNTDGENYINENQPVTTTNQLEIENINTNGEWKTITFYIATGSDEITFRFEMWNGTRANGQTVSSSSGYVFFDDCTITLASAFAEVTMANAFHDSTSILYGLNSEQRQAAILHKQPLSTLEKQFNVDYPDQVVSYDAKYVWASSATTDENNSIVYAIFNSLVPNTSNDPYASITPTSSGCSSSCSTTSTSPETFWLSFSSILLIVALVVAMIALIVKTMRRRKKAYGDDTTSHYDVSSRYTQNKKNKKAKKVVEDSSTSNSNVDENTEVPTSIDDNKQEEIVEETSNEQVEPIEEKKETLDDYVYGEVHDFGENAQTNEDKPVEENVETEVKPENENSSEENKDNK